MPAGLVVRHLNKCSTSSYWWNVLVCECHSAPSSSNVSHVLKKEERLKGFRTPVGRKTKIFHLVTLPTHRKKVKGFWDAWCSAGRLCLQGRCLTAAGPGWCFISWVMMPTLWGRRGSSLSPWGRRASLLVCDLSGGCCQSCRWFTSVAACRCYCFYIASV